MIVPTPKRYLYDLSHIYPATDGQPMAEGTTQYRFLVTIKGGLDIQYHDDANVFVAGDLFWYPVEGNPGIRKAPDVLVALGRPKGDRPSYLQWLEDNVPPQVVFEILSPGNRKQEMDDKFAFFERYGVEEYYFYDPQSHHLQGWRRTESTLVEILEMDGWVSPLLEIRFDMSLSELRVFGRDGRQFVDVPELDAQRQWAEERAELAERLAQQERRDKERAEQRARRERHDKEQAEQRARQAEQRAQQELRDKEQAEQRARQAEQRAQQELRDKEQAEQRARDAEQHEAESAAKAERLAAQLRALGIEPQQ